MGALMRQYWIPAFFAHELPAGRPVRGRLLGESLVAFRDASGQVGLIDERCAHRGASLYFGLKEEDGLRCVFHGWKFDIEGRCVDRPAAACDDGGNRIETAVESAALKAYPCVERGGLIWAFMGRAGTAPRLPKLDWLHVPEALRAATRELRKGNWLQALEQDEPAPALLLPFHTVSAQRAQAWVPVDDRHCMVYTIRYSAAHVLRAGETQHPGNGEASTRDVRRLLRERLQQAFAPSGEEHAAHFPVPAAPAAAA